MIDDSIVRGTTSGNIVQMLKNAGATEVHVRISSPPFKYPCYFGTDIPNRDQLKANHYTVEEIGGMIDVYKRQDFCRLWYGLGSSAGGKCIFGRDDIAGGR